MLKSMGFEVDFALNGRRFTKPNNSYTQPDNYKAVIMDLTIPEQWAARKQSEN